eukprot:2004803-Rhodomonas_salina.1
MHACWSSLHATGRRELGWVCHWRSDTRRRVSQHTEPRSLRLSVDWVTWQNSRMATKNRARRLIPISVLGLSRTFGELLPCKASFLPTFEAKQPQQVHENAQRSCWTQAMSVDVEQLLEMWSNFWRCGATFGDVEQLLERKHERALHKIRSAPRAPGPRLPDLLGFEPGLGFRHAAFRVGTLPFRLPQLRHGVEFQVQVAAPPGRCPGPALICLPVSAST